MNLDDDFKLIETKLANLNKKIRVKCSKINSFYNYDLNKIKNKQANADISLTTYQNYLNEHRDFLLQQIYAKRKIELNQINEIMESNCSIDKKYAAISKIRVNLEQNFFYLKSNALICLKDLLNKHEFDKKFDIRHIIKYEKLLVLKKQFKNNFDEDYCINSLNKFQNFLLLPSNHIFIYVTNDVFAKMLIIAKDGCIKYSKEFVGGKNFSIYQNKFYSNRTNIFRFYQNEDDESDRYTYCEIYNFKLETVGHIKFNKELSFDVVFGNHDIAFGGIRNNNIQIYDTNKFTTTRLSFIFEVFETRNKFNLVHMNKNYLYFVRLSVHAHCDMVLIMDRFSRNEVHSFYIKPRSYSTSVFFDRYSQIYDYDFENREINVYYSNGDFLYKIKTTRNIFENFRFSCLDKLIYNSTVANEFIEFDEY